MISEVEHDIISRYLSYQYNEGKDIGKILRSYNNLTFSEKNEIHNELTGKDLPISIEEAKAEKIAELSEKCNDLIEAGMDVEFGDIKEHFSYKLSNGDQTNIDNLVVFARTTGMPQPYHCDGGNCRMYSVEDVFKIYMTLVSNKTVQTTYFNQLKQYIMNEFKTDDDVKFVTLIKYGDQLTGKYMSKYVEIIEEATSIMNQTVSKLAKEIKANNANTNVSSIEVSKADPIKPESSTTREIG